MCCVPTVHLPLTLEVNKGVCIDRLGFMAINKIMKYLLVVTQSLTLISALTLHLRAEFISAQNS